MRNIKNIFLVFSLIAGMSLCASVAMKNAEVKEAQVRLGVAGPAGTIIGITFGL